MQRLSPSPRNGENDSAIVMMDCLYNFVAKGKQDCEFNCNDTQRIKN
jgi:hypothetical protein